MRSIRLLKDWSFQKNDGPVQQVRVPHDWAIAGPFDRMNDVQYTHIVQDGEAIDYEHNGRTGGLPYIGKGRYVCHIPGPSAPDRCTYLEFDGVMSHAKVYINGGYAAFRNYGYSSFRVNATSRLHDGENEVVVTAENKEDSSRWYPGAGIYRKVQLVETDPVHFGYNGLHLKYIAASDRLLVEGDIENCTKQQQAGKITLESPLFEAVSWECSLSPSGYHFVRTFELKPHESWDITHPVLYPVKFKVETDRYTDEMSLNYGIRTFRFDPAEGFFLNDRNVRLNGVCMHHDLGPLGAAFNRAAAKRQLEILREMGCNAIRTSHNPPAPDLLDLCDETGFLVMDEAFDCWQSSKLKNDYGIHFGTDAEMDIMDMVRRDRNHPSVILWSIGNELNELHDPKIHGVEIAKKLNDAVKSIDTERPTTIGCNASASELACQIVKQVDVSGWNYKPHLYAKIHHDIPDQPLFGSETLSAVSSRGVYYFPAREYVYYDAPNRKEHKELQCSSYCLDIMPWSTTPDTEMTAQLDCRFDAGQFIWTGFDYLGEPTPFNEEWPARSSYFGCVDLVGLPKDLFYLMQSLWLPKEKPMIHIVPHHWNWTPSQKIDVHVFSNCDEIELILNGKTLGRKKRRLSSSELYQRFRFIFEDVNWEPGELKATGYIEGKSVTEEILKTAGKEYALKLEAKRTQCAADGDDMLFVTVSVVDQKGVLCPAASPLAKFKIEGKSLCIAAADAGNAASTEPFHTPECHLFSGMAVVYLRSTGFAGESVLTAESAGIETASIKLEAR